MEQEPTMWDMMGDEERETEFNAVVVRNQRLTDALERLASEDYYGNYPVTRGIARAALKGGE